MSAVSGYIAGVPPQSRKALRQIRAAIRKAAPGITERISYRIPTFDLDGQYLLYMAGFEKHVSVYPVTAGMVQKYGPQLKKYRSGAGTLRFALDEPLPLALITKLAKVRVDERRAKAARPAKRPMPAKKGKPTTAARPGKTHPNAAAFPAGLSGPALRALANAGIRSVKDLRKWSDANLAALHGMGPKGVRILRERAR